ncbi:MULTISPECIES: hypothetical protein [unclassified Bradyrhizobium]|uniref:hypothetical protein n=1 Tax=unclassified Bradyrhizobium TaxID=2631580 RepID=UPI0012EB6C09|nr:MULTISPECIES: hypothetical protein [unclassified Bradyrhizobium]MCP3467906.1 hypothetical protein [Bradyrhizobium sp. CCGUVB23]
MLGWIWIAHNAHWLAALGFGAMIIGVYFWSRFDEPSYEGTSEYFVRYKPKFSTSRRRYLRAKLGYVFAILIVFFILSAVPEIFYALLPEELSQKAPKPSDTTLPLGVALMLIAFQTIPRLNEGERRIRGLLHSVARIPESIRRTVAQLRGFPFHCSAAAVALQTRKLGVQIGKSGQEPANLSKLIFEDDFLHVWYNTGCVLSALSENNQASTNIDPLFYDYYKEELDSINDRHIALALPVRKYLTERLRANSNPDAVPDPAAIREVRNLRDRLYTFVACGVRSSVRNDAESLDIISKLGFAVRPDPPRERRIEALVWLSLAALSILSVFAVWTTQLFENFVLKDEQTIEALKVPTELPGQFFWSWSTDAFYFFAILGALLIRGVHIGRREWFDINNFDRERPILRYAKPILLGGALGYIALVLIALLVGGQVLKVEARDISKGLVEAVTQTLPWAPLAIVIAGVALWLGDSPVQDARPSWTRILGRAVVGALVMMAAGFFTSSLAQPAVRQVGIASIYMSLFVAMQIGLVAFVLCIIVQISELYTDRGRSFAGQFIEASSRQGRLFSMYLHRDGTACLLSPNGGGLKSSAVRCQGHWQQFPEGTAVRWDGEGDACGKAGGFGLMSAFGDSLIYEAYAERFSGTPDFVAQLNMRASVDTTRPSPAPDPSRGIQPSAWQAKPADATSGATS